MHICGCLKNIENTKKTIAMQFNLKYNDENNPYSSENLGHIPLLILSTIPFA